MQSSRREGNSNRRYFTGREPEFQRFLTDTGNGIVSGADSGTHGGVPNGSDDGIGGASNPRYTLSRSFESHARNLASVWARAAKNVCTDFGDARNCVA